VSATIRVVHYGAHDLGYPRGRRVRDHLASLEGVELVTVPRSRAGSRLRRAAADVAGLWRASSGADVIVLAEFRTTHAPLVRAVAGLRGARVVVDGFIGLHETVVVDRGDAPARSSRARRLALHDALAVRCSDLYLIDTEPRAADVRRRPGAGAVAALAVGAPSWATWRPAAAPHPELRVLYYGGYIALHGVDLVVEALALASSRREVRAVFVGDGACRAQAEQIVRELGLERLCRFVDPVPESGLLPHLEWADVVLGVFGTSPKARSVVANKVWQGLACGRVVVTQSTPALDDVADVVGGQLVQVAGRTPRALADRLVALDPSSALVGTPGVHERLESLVARSYRPLTQFVLSEGGRS
jgi:hypothetical protein